MQVALEFVPFSNIYGLEQALDLAELAPNAGLVLDSWHVFRGGIALSDIAKLPANRVLCVQINDAKGQAEAPLAQDTLNRLPCGAGDFDLIGFLRVISETCSKAGVSVEIISPVFAALDAEIAAQASIRGIREILAASA
jgi:sugar phosphate isomerase/epimerase